jgi:hypothetical protein
MPTVKIGEVLEPCQDPEHRPPGHRVFEPGIYEHTCPKCGEKTVFVVHRMVHQRLEREADR